MAEKFIPVIEKIHKKNDYEDRINILNDEIKIDKEKLEQAVKQLEAKKEVYRSLEEKENLLEKEKQENYVPQDEFSWKRKTRKLCSARWIFKSLWRL